MRILIASDLHGALDSVTFLQKKVQALQPDLCLLLGDFLYHGPRNPLPKAYTPQDVANALNELEVEIMGVRGNCDAEVDESLLAFALHEQLRLHVDGYTVMATHGHKYGRYEPDFSSIKAGTIVISGHTHMPVAAEYNHVYWWNPGSLSLPKQGYPRSYGLYEQAVFRVFDMDDVCILEHKLPKKD